MADRIQIRRDLAANWTSANPVLAQGELGAETDTLKVKIGDGTTAWTSLAYFGAATLSELGDVTITSITSGELLKWNGTAWANNTIAEAGLATAAQGALADSALQSSDIGVSVQAWDADLDTWATKTAPTGDAVGTTDTQTLTNKTLTDPALIGAPVEDAYNLTGTDIDPANGTMQRKTTTGAETLTGTNFTVGQSVTLTLSAATSVTFTGFTWVTADGSAPTILSANDTFVLWMDQGSNKYVAYLGGTV